MTSINKFSFDPSEPINVVNSEGIYEADSIEFDATGVFLVRNGLDRVFIPWCDVVKVYQQIDPPAAAQVFPYAAPAQ